MAFHRLWVGVMVFLFSFAAQAASPLKVMTFNTMCDVCNGFRGFTRFNDRLDQIADTILRHDPDLIGLQEVRTRNQVRRIQNRLKGKYVAVFSKGFPLSYADPVQLVRKSRFKIGKKRGGWLGPKFPDFSFGWSTKIPRRMQSLELTDAHSGEGLLFVSAHFDNGFTNKGASAELLAKWAMEPGLPVIFAGDTNIKPNWSGYTTLTGAFRDTFHEVESIDYVANQPYTNSDGCNLNKGKTFPNCRVDHVLLSPSAPWRARSWGVDVYRYGKKRAFVSDHRAVIVELEPINP
jgi:endonuclease/exonuclease/phosphatase family metal-dependent hydrolase